MPTTALKHLAKRAHKKMGKAEHYWAKAKDIVSKEYGYSHDDSHYWALVTGITKRMMGLSEDEQVSFKTFLEAESRSFASELELVQYLSANYDKVGYKLKPKKVNVHHVRSQFNTPKLCYNNAFKYIMDHAEKLGQMKYVLGYVFLSGIPIEHAWVYDGQKYVDPTLDAAKYDAYISVLQFPISSIMDFTVKHKYPPTIYDAARAKLQST